MHEHLDAKGMEQVNQVLSGASLSSNVSLEPEVGLRVSPHLYVLEDLPSIIISAVNEFPDRASYEKIEQGKDFSEVFVEYLNQKLNPTDPEWESPFMISKTFGQVEKNLLALAILGTEAFELEKMPKVISDFVEVAKVGNIVLNRQWASADDCVHVLEHEEHHNVMREAQENKTSAFSILVDVHQKIMNRAKEYPVDLEGKTSFKKAGLPSQTTVAELLSALDPRIVGSPHEFWAQFWTEGLTKVPHDYLMHMYTVSQSCLEVVKLLWKPEYESALQIVKEMRLEARQRAVKDLEALREHGFGGAVN